MKKFLTTLLTVVLTATLAIGGTMAYLTQDAGDEKNVFSVGNIDVSLDEEVGVFGEGGEAKETEDGAKYTEIMPGDYLQKEVTVTNNGKTDAYVAVTVTLNNALEINEALDEYYEGLGYSDQQVQAVYDNVFDGWGINYDPRPGAYGVNDARGVIDGTHGLPEHVLHVDFAKTTAGSTVIGANNWFIAGSEKAGQYWVDGPKEYDGYYTKNMEDYEICYTYYLYLPAGESSTLFNGLNVPAEFDANQLAMFESLEINIEAKAIQADNMGIADEYADDEQYGKAKTAFAILAEDIEAKDVDVDNTPEEIVNGDDDNVTYPAPADAYVVNNADELKTAVANGETTLLLKNGTYNIDGCGGKNLNLYGESKNAIIEVTGGAQGEVNGQLDYGLDGSTVTFNGLTIKTNSNTYAGYARLNGTYNDCVMDGHYSLNGTSEFNFCTLNVSGDQYNVWTWGAPQATFTRCTFNSDGKAMMLYGTANTKLTIESCKFNDTGVLPDLKAAIEVGNDYNKTYELIVNNTTVNGYEINDKGISTGTTLWANKNSMSNDMLNVVVDGVDVY
ncbi:MAG: hypothetical protein J6B94_11375 [Lachnospiraceae bacterium]|nr:hypothetical protein [Lachnospiraceae bacterium]